MDTIIEFFGSLETRPILRMALLVLPITLLWIMESSIPLFRLRYKTTKGKHAVVNFVLTFFHLAIHSLLAVVLVLVSDWCQQHQFGLVHWLHMPVWGILLTGILGMDFFGGWLVHFVEHKVPLFWRIHIVHHADNKIDVSTGLRHHPLEGINRWLFFTLGVLLTGLPIYAVMLGQTFMSMFTMFTHANINLPPWLDNAISWIFISPNAHKVHHHYKQPYTDSNFGTALSIWDRVFGTYRYLAPDAIRYGLDHHYPNAADENLLELLKSPFKKLDKVKSSEDLPPQQPYAGS